MKQKFAVFDIDGTLIRWQLFHTIVEQLALQGSIAEVSYQTVTELLEKWKKRDHNDAFAAYETAVLDAWYTVLTEIKHDEYLAAVDTVFEHYKDQVYRYTRDLIKKLKASGYYLIAISGSHQEVVQKIADYYQFDHAVGSVYPTKNGKFTGEEIAPVLAKGEVLREIVQTHDLSWDESYAVGDSRNDSTMMQLVEHPIAFNPDQRLITIAKQQRWPIIVERKNVVYRLVPNSSGYTLVET